MKNKKLNQWLWKWHVIAGLISAPFILLLAITGIIYLFNEDYIESETIKIANVKIEGTSVSYQEQLNTANAAIGKSHKALILPENKQDATQFLHGDFRSKKTTYVNPYTNKITGKTASDEGIMFKVRKLHGELLLGGFGTKIVELIASWMVVLLITGVFIWWPVKGWNIQGFFLPRFTKGREVLLRDMHAITAFWISGLLLLVLAGGFPWTDIVGSNFKQLQKITNAGYPKHWRGFGFNVAKGGEMISLDKIVKKAQELDLPGSVRIDFPKGPTGVYSIGNTYFKDSSLQQKNHYNPYTGKLVLQQKWEDVGVLMRGRMWVMAFHQGQFGNWNWWLMISVALFLVISTASAIFLYFLKKEKWFLPKVPRGFVVSKFVILVIVFLGLLFPLFGISALLIFLIERRRLARNK